MTATTTKKKTPRKAKAKKAASAPKKGKATKAAKAPESAGPKKPKAAKMPPIPEGQVKKPSGDPTLLEVAQGYLASLEKEGRSATTIFSYRNELRRALAELGETTRLGKLTAARVDAYFRSDRVTKSRSGKPLNQRSIDKTRRVLRLALVWVLVAGWVKEIPLSEKATQRRSAVLKRKGAANRPAEA